MTGYSSSLPQGTAGSLSLQRGQSSVQTLLATWLQFTQSNNLSSFGIYIAMTIQLTQVNLLHNEPDTYMHFYLYPFIHPMVDSFSTWTRRMNLI